MRYRVTYDFVLEAPTPDAAVFEANRLLFDSAYEPEITVVQEDG